MFSSFSALLFPYNLLLLATPLHIIICHNFSDFSYADSSRQLALKLISQGHHVTFYSHTEPVSNPASRGLTVLRWPEKRPTGLASFLAIYKTIREQNTDVVLVHAAALNMAGLAAALAGVKKRIGYYHSAYEATLIDNKASKLTQWLQRKRKQWFYSCYHQMICVSQFAAKDLVKWFGYRAADTRIIFNALADRYQRETLLPKPETSTVRFLSLGRLDSGKNIPAMLKGFLLFEQSYSGKARLQIAGTGPDLKYVEQLCGESTGVEYLGHMPYHNIDDAMQQTHVVVNSTLAEAFGMTIIEAMMNATPVLVSAVGGIPELVADGIEGWLVSGSSAENWKAAFERAYLEISQHPHQYMQKRESARKHFMKSFQQKQQLEALESIITG